MKYLISLCSQMLQESISLFMFMLKMKEKNENLGDYSEL
jgi:hypothetical protein